MAALLKSIKYKLKAEITGPDEYTRYQRFWMSIAVFIIEHAVNRSVNIELKLVKDD